MTTQNTRVSKPTRLSAALTTAALLAVTLLQVAQPLGIFTVLPLLSIFSGFVAITGVNPFSAVGNALLEVEHFAPPHVPTHGQA